MLILGRIGGAGGEQGAIDVEHVSVYFALLFTLSGRDLTWCSSGARGAPTLSRRFLCDFRAVRVLFCLGVVDARILRKMSRRSIS